MRPVPKARHLAAVAIILVIGAFTHLHAVCQSELTDQQVRDLVNMLRSTNGQLYQHDAVFGDSGLWRFRTPVWQWYLHEAYVVGGQKSVLNGLTALAGPLMLIYLLGMYVLLYGQCRSWSIACYVSVLSIAVIPLAGEGWGLGPLSSISASTVFLAAVPWLAVAFVATVDSPAVLWVFLGIGVLANIHAVTGMNLALVAAGALLAHRRFNLRTCFTVLGASFCTLAGASPFLAYHFTQKLHFAGDTAATWSAAAMALGPNGLNMLLPSVLGCLLILPTLGYMLALSVPAAGAILLPGRLAVKNSRLWLGMFIAAAAVGLGLHALSQLLGVLMDRTPPVSEFIHALRFLMLPFYVLLADAIVQIARLGISRRPLRVALAAGLALWLVPSDNLALVRQWAEHSAASIISVGDHSESVRHRLTEPMRGGEVQAIGRYLQKRTPLNTVVVCDDSQLRLWSRRALVVCDSDVKYLYYLAPRRLDDWAKLLAQQQQVLSPKAGDAIDVAALDAFAHRHEASYVVLPASQPVPAIAAKHWVIPEDGSWGSYWRLYCVNP